MKPGDTGLDDLLNEAQFVLRDDGRWRALALLRVLTWLSLMPKTAISLALRLPWRRGALSGFPKARFEPFNLAPDELEREWRQR
jgi:hypothetical protein